MHRYLPITFLAFSFAIGGCLSGPSSGEEGASPNTLTEAEKADGWELLWDGKTLDGWTRIVRGKCQPVPKIGWTIEDGALTIHSRKEKAFRDLTEGERAAWGGDIATVRKFRDFDLKFEFRLTDRANSGVKYYLDETQDGVASPEYQVMHPGNGDFDRGTNGNRRVASLYDMIPAHADHLLKPTGEWNSGRIVGRGKTVQHWLNGEKVIEFVRGSPEYRALVKASKFAKWGKSANNKPHPWGEIEEGRILLQDHHDCVSFRNLKIRVGKH